MRKWHAKLALLTNWKQQKLRRLLDVLSLITLHNSNQISNLLNQCGLGFSLNMVRKGEKGREGS